MEPGHGEDRPHVPPPSLWPVGFAIGIACILVGLVVNPLVIIPIGVVIAAIFAFLWIRDASAEYRHVPEIEPETRAGAEPAPALPADEGGAAMPEPSPGERFPRSKFLEFSTLGIGAAIGGIVTVPALGFAVLPAFVGQGYDEIDLGPLDNFPEGQWIITKFRSVRDEPEDVSRRTAYIRNNGQRDGEPSFTIISNRCVHLGCPVQPQGLTEEKPREIETRAGRVELFETNPSGFVCPCHGGAYDQEGNRTAGPPVRALDRYRFSIKGGRLVLGEPYSVGEVVGAGADARMEAYRIADPGVHVDGPEQFFYPYVP